MHKISSLLIPLFIAASLGALSACSTMGKSGGRQEDFMASDVHAYGFSGSDKATCEAARRALLSQGYVINEAGNSLVRGRKNFQPRSDQHVQIEFHVVCASNSPGSHSATAFANAVRDTYSLKKSSTSASVGVGALGSLSLPFGSSDESLVKVGSETIDSKRFYEQFFALVERYFDGTGYDPSQQGDDPPQSGAGLSEEKGN